MNTSPLPPLPELLQTVYRDHFSRLPPHEQERLQPPPLFSQAETVLACSPFIAEALIQQSGLLTDLIESGDLLRSYPIGHYTAQLRQRLTGVEREEQLWSHLRQFRRRELVRLAWRDLAGCADLPEMMAEISALADALINGALESLYPWQCAQWGTPVDSGGQPQPLVILGMGKLGAAELNFSSDIDLIFAYPEDGETVGGRRSLSHQEFFIKLGQKLIAALGSVTGDGFVYRVDMRLRPFGEVGPLALSFDALEHYYQTHGREWERYALIKARPLTDPVAGQELMARIRPFIYRKYIDFGAFESLREMKGMIAAEVHKKGADRNVKLGAGGIREVEFIGQAFQLIRGGRIAALQIRPILSVLEQLKAWALLPAYVADDLTHDYTFLRRVENRLQEFADQQTHQLPEDELGQQRLAYAMGYRDWPLFLTELRRRMRRVHQSFEQVFAAPQSESSADHPPDPWRQLWQGELEAEAALALMESSGYRDPAESLRLLQQWQQSRLIRQLQPKAQQRLNQLMPLLLGAVTQVQWIDNTLQRLLEILQQVVRRSTYLALLVENPLALSQLIRLCHASPWIATAVATSPQLMDNLLDPRLLYEPLSRPALTEELTTHLAPLTDEEGQLEELRRFKRAHLLRVAAADVMEAVPLMRVSDALTEIAETVVEGALQLAVTTLRQRHGQPAGVAAGQSGFGVIAYGKFGGIELGYGSDLDLVFLRSGSDGVTDGVKSIDNATYFARLGQRFIHLMTTRTVGGLLYEIDTRLRPHGQSGALVYSLTAYHDYLAKEAWVWEHQALVRARCVAGDPEVARQFEAIRRQILTQPREEQPLRQAVVEMRQKMRTALSKDSATEFDLKQGVGGIADIEFMVQYRILLHAHAHPQLVDYTDNIRQLQQLAAAGLMEESESQNLIALYQRYRAQLHQNALQEQPARVEATRLSSERDSVRHYWHNLLAPVEHT